MCGDPEASRRAELRCRVCSGVVHKECIGIDARALPSGWYTCADCNAAVGANPTETEAIKRWCAVATRVSAAAVKASTWKTYDSRLQSIVKWARSEGIGEGTVFPRGRSESMPEGTLLALIAYASQGKWAEATMDLTMAAVSAWHLDKGVADTTRLPSVERALQGAKKETLRFGNAGRGAKLPVTREQVVAVLADLEVRAQVTDTARRDLYFRDQTWIIIGFMGLLRRKELGSLRLSDVKLEPAQRRVRILVRESKTDPGRGHWVWLNWTSRSALRAGEIVSRWVAVRRRAAGGDGEAALFTRWVRQRSSFSQVPLKADGDAMGRRLKEYLGELARRHGWDLFIVSAVAMHSLRRGGANALKEDGATDFQVQEHGRWSSECFSRYFERRPEERLELTRQM